MVHFECNVMFMWIHNLHFKPKDQLQGKKCKVELNLKPDLELKLKLNLELNMKLCGALLVLSALGVHGEFWVQSALLVKCTILMCIFSSKLSFNAKSTVSVNWTFGAKFPLHENCKFLCKGKIFVKRTGVVQSFLFA